MNQVKKAIRKIKGQQVPIIVETEIDWRIANAWAQVKKYDMYDDIVELTRKKILEKGRAIRRRNIENGRS